MKVLKIKLRNPEKSKKKLAVRTKGGGEREKKDIYKIDFSGEKKDDFEKLGVRIASIIISVSWLADKSVIPAINSK